MEIITADRNPQFDFLRVLNSENCQGDDVITPKY